MLEVPAPVGSMPQIRVYLSKAYLSHLSNRDRYDLGGALHMVVFERFNNNN